MTGKTLLTLNLAGALLALAACGGPAIHFTDFNATYTHGEVRYATKGGPLPVETFGRVALEDLPQDQTMDRTVAHALSRFGPHWFAAGFTADMDADPDPYYRVRWIFNPPVDFPWYSACAKDLGIQARAWREETGLVIAAFCRGTRFLSAARGSYGRPEAVDPEGFPRFVGIMGQVLLPPRNPDMDQDDCKLPTGCA